MRGGGTRSLLRARGARSCRYTVRHSAGARRPVDVRWRAHQGDGPGDGDDLCRLDIVLEAAHGALRLSGVRVDCHAGSVRHHALAGGSSAERPRSWSRVGPRARLPRARPARVRFVATAVGYDVA